MSDLQPIEATDPDLDSRIDSDLSEYIENSSRTDGSRTPIWKIARCHEMKRAGRSVNAISEILGMDARTVNAVLARQDHLITDARMLLKANALGFVGDLIQASQEAAKRGKTEGIAAVLDRLDVTQPPKGQHASQVAVQINLHGGPEPQSLVVGSQSLETPMKTGLNTHGSDNGAYVDERDPSK
jgi:hypothetical protein